MGWAARKRAIAGPELVEDHAARVRRLAKEYSTAIADGTVDAHALHLHRELGRAMKAWRAAERRQELMLVGVDPNVPLAHALAALAAIGPQPRRRPAA